MMKNLKKSLAALAVLSLTLAAVLTVASSASAATANELLWGNQQGAISNTIGLGNQDPRIIAAQIINVVLGFLGIIAVVIILLGGFKWMTAGGNEDKVGEAKGLLAAGVIGLIIILAAWGLATFVVNLIYNATT